MGDRSCMEFFGVSRPLVLNRYDTLYSLSVLHVKLFWRCQITDASLGTRSDTKSSARALKESRSDLCLPPLHLSPGEISDRAWRMLHLPFLPHQSSGHLVLGRLWNTPISPFVRVTTSAPLAICMLSACPLGVSLVRLRAQRTTSSPQISC